MHFESDLMGVYGVWLHFLYARAKLNSPRYVLAVSSTILAQESWFSRSFAGDMDESVVLQLQLGWYRALCTLQ